MVPERPLDAGTVGQRRGGGDTLVGRADPAVVTRLSQYASNGKGGGRVYRWEGAPACSPAIQVRRLVWALATRCELEQVGGADAQHRRFHHGVCFAKTVRVVYHFCIAPRTDAGQLTSMLIRVSCGGSTS